MLPFVLSFVTGAALLQQQPTLPDALWIGLPALLAPAILLPRDGGLRRLRQIALAVFALALGFAYAAWLAAQRLDDALPADWQGRNIELSGVVAELPGQHPRGLRFAFDVEQVLTAGATVPKHIQLATYDGEQSGPLTLHAGERWQLTVRLKQPHGSVNPYGFDFEGWLLERNLRATGYVYGKGDNRRLDPAVGQFRYRIERWREQIRTRLGQVLAGSGEEAAPYAGVLAALAIGDQGSISASDWQIFTRTGVNHLMSISGLHITMLGGLAFSLVYPLWRRIPRLTLRLPARKAAALAGLLVALIYALLSGFSVPAQRTVYMLATVAALLLVSRNSAPSQLLLAALLVVTLADPWAVLSPGFWLSFGAVGLILFITAHRLRAGKGLREYARVQWAMSIGLVPLLLALFQQISLVSPLANAFAIPLVSLVVVPLTLLGAALPLDFPLWWAHSVMSVCMAGLNSLNALPSAVWTQAAPPLWSVLVGVGGVVWSLLPRGFPARWLGGLALLPMFLSPPELPPVNTLRLLIFDVGQGLAVLAQTHDHALLYDTGADFSGETDSGSRILFPSLRAQGIAGLDGLIVSHDDNDHSGGAASILQLMPVGWLASSRLEALPLHVASRPCVDGDRWQWDGVQFEFLSPPSDARYRAKAHDNNRSCVLRIGAGEHSVLLAADIEKKTENYLLQQHADQLAATLLVVPHHGSKTSSHPAWVAAVHPRYAVFTVGYRNRFGHPKPEIVERYRVQGSEVLRSDADGAIVLTLGAGQPALERWRLTHRRYWYAD